MNTILRLDFGLARGDLAAARRRLTSAATSGAPTARRCNLVYLDTADLARRDDPPAVELIRLSRAAAPGERKWLDPFDPRIAARDPLTLAPRPAGDAAAAGEARLAPVLHRRSTVLTAVLGAAAAGDGAPVMVARLEFGVMRSAAEATPIARLSFEQIDGSLHRFFEAVAAWRRVLPLALASEDPVAAAYRDLLHADPRIRTAKPVSLSGAHSPEAGLAAIIAECLAHLQSNQPAMLRGDAPAAVHQSRVAIRRLRAALSLFRGAMPQPRESWVRAELRWFIAVLGEARDWDVFLDLTLPPVEHAFYGADGFAGLRAAAHQARETAYRAVADAIRSERYQQLLLEIQCWIAALREVRESRWPTPDLAGFAAAAIGRRYAKALKLGPDLAALPAGQRHALRLEVKKLRYAVSFFRSLYGARRMRRFLAALARLQDRLGRSNDLNTANRLTLRLTRRGDDPGPSEPGSSDADRVMVGGLIVGWQAAIARREVKKADKLWRGFVHGKPSWR